MPSTAAIKATIEQSLVTALPTVPTDFRNVPFTPPAGQAWLRVWVLWGASQRRTMQPTKTNMLLGLVQVDIFTPQSIGEGVGMRLADQVRAVYNRRELSSVRFDVPSGPIPLEQETINQQIWERSSIRCNFNAEETAP